MRGEAPDDVARLVEGKANALDVDSGYWLHWPQPLDERPLARAAGDAGEECLPDGLHVRLAAGDDQNGQLKLAVQGEHVHDVESGEGDALQHDELKVRGELGGANDLGQAASRVGSIFADAPAQYTLQARARVDRADDRHIAAMRGGEGEVVKTDDMRDTHEEV